jgi:DNA invertase Pin-like site-specific DNA recombinase
MKSLPMTDNVGRAAMYVRMSTEHQQYSTENQAEVIKKYASSRNLVIVKTFVDHGKSGLTLSGRLALRKLLQEVQSGAADFEAILAYDVSRRGRFQNAEESAYYEYRCKQAHVQVHYCAEQFENDGSPTSALLKTIKRSMAAECNSISETIALPKPTQNTNALRLFSATYDCSTQPTKPLNSLILRYLHHS